MTKSWGAAIAAVALICSPVRATCWDAQDASAATVRELQSLLMVATLRCHAAGYDIAGDYNEFLRANRTAIIGMNDRLKAHFIRTQGPAVGQRAYDTFTTSMANGYGAASSSADICASMGAIEREASLMAGSVDGLVMIAEREALPVDLPGGRCERAPMMMASLSTARSIAAAVQPNGTPMIASRTDAAPAMVRSVIEAARGGGDQVLAGLSYIPGH